MYIGTGHDISAAADALDADRPWSAAAVAETELPDFSPQRRWTTVVLAAAGIVALAALVAAVITMANRSSHPAQETPPAPTTASATPTATAPLPASPSAPSAAPLPPPDFSSVTATASTMAPPPPARPGQSEPKTGVRERLRDLFPRLFPDR